MAGIALNDHSVMPREGGAASAMSASSMIAGTPFRALARRDLARP